MCEMTFLYLALCFVTTTPKSLAEVVLVGGPVHSPASTIQTNFSENITLGKSYSIQWKFDDIIVCVIPITRLGLDNPSCIGSTYYNDNSNVNATLNSNVLEAVFTYGNVTEENDTITVSVADFANSNFLYGQSNLSIKVCPDPAHTVHVFDAASSPEYCNNTVYNYYNCVVSFSCAENFQGNEVKATCSENAEWSNDIFCVPVGESETTTAPTHIPTESTHSVQTELITTAASTPSTSSCATCDCHTDGLSSAAVAAISICVGIVIGIIGSSAVWWWMTKRIDKKKAIDSKNQPAYEPTYVDPQGLESAYEVMNQKTIDGDGQVASQQQTSNVNSAYEVIR